MASKETQKRVTMISQYQTTFNSPSGKAVLVDLMKGCHVQSSTMHELPHVMAYKEGQRDTVLRILKMLKIDHRKLLEELEKQEERNE